MAVRASAPIVRPWNAPSAATSPVRPVRREIFSDPSIASAPEYHPVKGVFTHVDFFGVDLNKEIKVDVPLEFVGTSKGVKLGGTLETYRERVTLQARPQDMPRKLAVNVTDMGLNSSIRASELALPEGVKVVFKNDFTVVAVLSEQQEAAEAAE